MATPVYVDASGHVVYAGQPQWVYPVYAQGPQQLAALQGNPGQALHDHHLAERPSTSSFSSTSSSVPPTGPEAEPKLEANEAEAITSLLSFNQQHKVTSSIATPASHPPPLYHHTPRPHPYQRPHVTATPDV